MYQLYYSAQLAACTPTLMSKVQLPSLGCCERAMSATQGALFLFWNVKVLHASSGSASCTTTHYIALFDSGCIANMQRA